MKIVVVATLIFSVVMLSSCTFRTCAAYAKAAAPADEKTPTEVKF